MRYLLRKIVTRGYSDTVTDQAAIPINRVQSDEGEPSKELRIKFMSILISGEKLTYTFEH